MKRRSSVCLIGAMLGVAAVWWQPGARGGAEEAAWISSYEEGQRIARRTGKALFVVFRCER